MTDLLVCGDLLYAHRALSGLKLNNFVDQEEWVTVRKHILDLEDIKDRLGLCNHRRPALSTLPGFSGGRLLHGSTHAR